ncbi:hypothetical protein SAMN04488498_113122 [Mesorhizobium albiziae]|uniref:Uncharacterized protein n=1 Tax=Neomesorhizobium albiziae TaxID=335020 RepID=A0A1I4CJW6_9HYPH|nr:hypothetical protein [Mesorhizobium albiziae]GLS29318.1 hypothetical protein GCM10007937_10260 [Mesorhizobium albiziae]SFK81528.1 hypothetical protein SAMN04488498_113122 [Mesorhizobium albiziae]
MPNTAVRAAAEGLPAKKPLTYMDLESAMHDAVNMAEVACEIIERTQCAGNRTTNGYRLADSEMHMLTFVIYHTLELANALKAKFNAIHESNGGEPEGGAA